MKDETKERSTWWSLLVLSCALGCGGPGPVDGPPPTPFWVDGETQDHVDQPVDGEVSSDGIGPEDGSPRPPSMESYYVSVRVNRRLTQDPSPFGDDWAESLTATIGLVKIVWDGEAGTRWEQVCAMWSNRVHGSQILYSAAFVAAIPVDPIAITRVGNVLTEAADRQWIGLETGYEDAMPALGDDRHPALADTDTDGNPGATIDIDMSLFGNQKLFIAQRTHTSWSATPDAAGQLYTELTTVAERVVVGATTDLLVAETRSKSPTEKPEDTLRWYPLEAPISCEDLLADVPAWTGDDWPPTDG